MPSLQPRFRVSFQTKILVPVLALLVVVSALTFWVVSRQMEWQMEADAARSLSTAEMAFRHSLDIRQRASIAQFQTAAKEPRFRAVAQLGDPQTMTDFLRGLKEEYGDRAEALLFITADGEYGGGVRREPEVLAEYPDVSFFSTNPLALSNSVSESVIQRWHRIGTELSREEAARAELGRLAVVAQRLLSEASRGETVAGFITHQDRVVSAVAVPVVSGRGRQLDGLFLVVMQFDEGALAELKSLTHTDIAVLARGKVAASTIPAEQLIASLTRASSQAFDPSLIEDRVRLQVNGEHFLTVGGNYVSDDSGHGFRYLLLSSYEERLHDLRQTQRTLAIISASAALAAFVVLGFAIRRAVVPLRRLRDGAEAVGRGDFTQRVHTGTNDECGDLAIAFNGMVAGLQTSREELEQTVAALRAADVELRRARDAAEASSRAKSEFLANMSHELRTPMNAIIGLSSLVEERVAAGEDADSVRTIRQSAQSLLGLIDDILDLVRAESDQITLNAQPFEVLPCLESLVTASAAACTEKGLALALVVEGPLPQQVLGDERRVRGIFKALLSNAVKFTPKGGVCLQVSWLQTGTLRVVVEDTGVGIPAHRKAHLFEAFSQVESSASRRFGGLGLGLALSQHLVKLMEGSLEVMSEEGRGSRFAVSLPLARVGAGEEAWRSWEGRRFAVRHRNPVLGKWIQVQLETWGATVQGLDQSLPVEGADAELSELSSGTDMRGVEAAKVDLDSAQTLICSGPLLPREFQRRLAERFIRRAALVRPPESLTNERPALRILLVEDNPINSRVALLSLKRLGYTADWAVNGVEGLAKLREVAYDFVLMDLQMPEMDGLEATRKFRELVDIDHGPYICALTANALPEDRAACRQVGMHDFLAKPLQLPALATALEVASVRRVKQLAAT